MFGSRGSGEFLGHVDNAVYGMQCSQARRRCSGSQPTWWLLLKAYSKAYSLLEFIWQRGSPLHSLSRGVQRKACGRLAPQPRKGRSWTPGPLHVPLRGLLGGSRALPALQGGGQACRGRGDVELSWALSRTPEAGHTEPCGEWPCSRGASRWWWGLKSVTTAGEGTTGGKGISGRSEFPGDRWLGQEVGKGASSRGKPLCRHVGEMLAKRWQERLDICWGWIILSAFCVNTMVVGERVCVCMCMGWRCGMWAQTDETRVSYRCSWGVWSPRPEAPPLQGESRASAVSAGMMRSSRSCTRAGRPLLPRPRHHGPLCLPSSLASVCNSK